MTIRDTKTLVDSLGLNSFSTKQDPSAYASAMIQMPAYCEHAFKMPSRCPNIRE